MKLYSKQELIDKFLELSKMGWVENGRFGNHGGIGNTLEDFLGIEENNLPIPNAAEWELKSQRSNTTSLTTLFHMEPSPRAIGFVPKVLLPLYAWQHQEAGQRYGDSEMSFRQTIHGGTYSDRGFKVIVDRNAKKVLISFDSTKVNDRHRDWLKQVESRVGLSELTPQPYWGFEDLKHKAGTKLLNCFYVQADTKKEEGKEFYWYRKVQMLRQFRFEGLLEGIETGNVLVDFDARTGHNHGTKFRLKQNHLPLLYDDVSIVVSV